MRFNRTAFIAVIFILTLPLTLQAQYAGPTLSSPADGTAGLTTAVTMSWGSVSGAVTYECLLAGDAAFTDTVSYDKGITGLSDLVRGLTTGKTYYWKARAYIAVYYMTHVDYIWSDWSSIWSYTTYGIPPVPVLVSPADGSAGVPINTTLVWNPSRDAGRYHLQLATDSLFGGLTVDDSTITGSSQNVGPLTYGGRYFWRVRAIDSLGSSGYSTAFAFNAFEPPVPDTPELLYPADGRTLVETNPRLLWRRSANAVSYTISLYYDPPRRATRILQTTTADTSLALSGLEENRLHYWNVLALNIAGAGSQTMWSFTTTMGLPSVPDPISPANASTGVPINTVAVWSASQKAVHYHFQLALDAGFTGIIVNDSLVSDTSRPIGPLAYASTYYWRVRATDAAGSCDFSAPFSFTVMEAPPVAAPQLISPSEDEHHVALSPEMRWSQSNNPVAYRLTVATDSLLQNIVFEDSTLRSLTHTIGPLAPGTPHYWRVGAKNQTGRYSYSTLGRFTTIHAVPRPPVLQLPADQTGGIPSIVILVWNPSADAASYRLQLSTAPGFEQTIVDDSAFTGTSCVVRNLQYATTYYWRVSAKNDGGLSPYSTMWRFTTAEAPPPLPDTPVLLDPKTGTNGVALSPHLRWSSSAWALAYHIQVSRDTLFSIIVLEDTLSIDTAKTAGPLEPAATYYWRVRARNTTGYSEFSPVWSFTTLLRTGIRFVSTGIPKEFELGQNYPNPFNPRTVIRVGLPHRAEATLTVFDIFGKQVATLMSGEYEGGVYEVGFDGSNLASGVYFAVCKLEKQQIVRRMILLK